MRWILSFCGVYWEASAPKLASAERTPLVTTETYLLQEEVSTYYTDEGNESSDKTRKKIRISAEEGVIKQIGELCRGIGKGSAEQRTVKQGKGLLREDEDDGRTL